MEIKEDIGQQCIDKLDEIEERLQCRILPKVERIVKEKKNSHLHLLIETNVISEMKKEAEEQNISLSEWCRRKLSGDSQLDRIEEKLDGILDKGREKSK